MIFNYGYSVVGKSHIAKGTCCQDSHMIKELDNGWVIAAIADGVGSAKNSQIGSSIAAKTVVEFCAEYMPWDFSVIGIKSMLRTAYNYAFKQIIRESEKTGEPIESYDTTLTTVIYDGHRVIYGHSGDGAIIGLTVYGDYVQITKPQKGVDMVSVLPLRSGYTVWSIDSYEEELVAVMLMTDGMLDYALCPYLLRQSEKSEVYTPIASFFADPYGVPKSEKKAEKTKNDIREFITADENYEPEKFYERLATIYTKHLNKEANKLIENLKEKNHPLAFMQSVQDDKTMVAIINTDIQFDTKEIEHFSEPNWDLLQEKWNQKAYPHLYLEKKTESSKIDTQSKEETATQTDSNQDKESVSVGTQETTKTDCVECEYPDVRDLATPTVVLQGKTKEFVDKKKQQQVADGELSNSNNPTKETINLGSNKPTKAVQSTNQHPTRHEKPKKEGLLGKISDFFN